MKIILQKIGTEKLRKEENPIYFAFINPRLSYLDANKKRKTNLYLC